MRCALPGVAASAGGALSAIVALSASPAHAEAPASSDTTQVAQAANDPNDKPAPPTRRNGFTLGVDLGAGVASIVGFPNDLNKIGYSKWYTATGVRPAGVVEAWAGGALVDWFTVTLGFTWSRLGSTGSLKAESYGGVMHLEAFPLFLLSPREGWLRDLGVRFDAGVGTGSVTDPSGTKLVDGSFGSIIGGGVFWEGLRAWKTAHGPFVMGDYLWADTIRRPAVFIGWRSVIYAGSLAKE